MSDFHVFQKAVQEKFQEMVDSTDYLYETEVDKDEMWNLYLDSFPAGTNEIYRQRREYDCSCCRNFIKRIGNVVSLRQGVYTSIWDIDVDDLTFRTVAAAMSAYVKSKPIADVFHTVDKSIGFACDYEIMDDGSSRRWDHFYLAMPNKFIDHSKLSEGDYKGRARDVRNVFKRSLDEISKDSVETVLELIYQNSLYRGEEWKVQLQKFLSFKTAYDQLTNEKDKELFAWENSQIAGPVVGKIRNHSIGTLLVDISENEDLDTAVRKYEAVVAPANYKRPKAIFTKKMVEEAQKKIVEMGFENSLGRRYATLNDITVNNILYSNRDAAKSIAGALDVFEDMKTDAKQSPKSFDHVEEIGISDFIANVLPTTKDMEVWFENRHKDHMVSLIAPKDPDAKTMFKWNNGFSWAYTGNMTDSMIRENVKNAGGKVDGVLRFSIQWNDEDYNPNDFDAHCVQPGGREIFFRNKNDYLTKGELDVDIIAPQRNVPAVENITWPSTQDMRNGDYHFFVHCFTQCGGRSGFKAEIECNGEVHYYEYPQSLRQGEKVQVAVVTFENGKFTVKDLMKSTSSSKEIWNVKTNQFVPITVMMYSPNYWDNQNGIGNRHYFFIMKDCVNSESPNGFYNEFLCGELMEHKRVLEALGSKLHVEDSKDQLSGLGFSSTQHNDLIVRVTGATKRVLKVKF